jgi:hypothetical protein
MELAAIVHQYYAAFKAKYASRLSAAQHAALQAILRCRTPQAGELLLGCSACAEHAHQPRSCGHRSCPKCQNHEASQWLERQYAKLLPVEYFMVTFTLPDELRELAWENPATLYQALFACASSTLADFGLNPRHLGAHLGLTAVLHTHSRRLDYHPHVHFIVPGGGIDEARRQWKKKAGKYLFNELALAKVFRARLLAALNAAGLAIPHPLPTRWVVHCTHVGKGKPALQYLSRYLYRGVLSERNIVANENDHVTFQYTEARSATTQYRRLRGEDFLWLVLQHVLPKGFRRVRDYGFLHGNARKRLQLVQLLLHVTGIAPQSRPRPAFHCPRCHAPMQILAIIRPAWASG